MRVVFRADAGTDIGTGHVMRCLTLADELARLSADVEFISSDQPGNLHDRMTGAHGFKTFPIPAGTDARRDAELSAHFLQRSPRPDWLVVDSYALGEGWERAMSTHVERIMVIDDLAEARHYCNLLLNQNLQSAPGAYEGLVPEGCSTLLGPSYALLRPEFADARTELGERASRVERVLVSFGGTDPTGETLKLLKQVMESGPAAQLHFDIVVGRGNADLPELTDLVAGLPSADLHVQTQQIAKLMAEADICIGAGGATTWERCCLGLPTLAVAVADNQVPNCELLGHLGYGFYLGNALRQDIDYVAALEEALRQSEALVGMSRRGMELVDGRGVSRVASRLLGVAR